MSFPIEAKFMNTQEHFLEACRWNGRYLLGRARRVFVWACMLILFLLGLSAIGGTGELRIIGIWAVGFPLVLTANAFLIRPYRFRKIFAEQANQGCEVIWRFFEDEIEVEAGKNNSRFEWSAFVQAGISRHGVSLFPQRNISHWIPATAFASEAEYARFLGLLKSRVSRVRHVT